MYHPTLQVYSINANEFSNNSEYRRPISWDSSICVFYYTNGVRNKILVCLSRRLDMQNVRESSSRLKKRKKLLNWILNCQSISPIWNISKSIKHLGKMQVFSIFPLRLGKTLQNICMKIIRIHWQISRLKYSKEFQFVNLYLHKNNISKNVSLNDTNIDFKGVHIDSS